ncbi:MAG: phosphatidylglycerophosphatase A [Gammaproteobacteria bacterium]|nr:phosphatidylglycerophosphatase A [Gammaproteobacteria bacterium]
MSDPATHSGAEPREIWRQPVPFLAFGFGSGLASSAPGTCGTLVAVPLAWWLTGLPVNAYAGVVLAAFAFGIAICADTTQRLGVADHPAIVWDEIVGYMAALLWLPRTWWVFAAAFVLFRIFDIAKPWPIGVADRCLKGGFGIMVDDLLAAVYVNLILQVAVHYFL